MSYVLFKYKLTSSKMYVRVCSECAQCNNGFVVIFLRHLISVLSFLVLLLRFLFVVGLIPLFIFFHLQTVSFSVTILESTGKV